MSDIEKRARELVTALMQDDPDEGESWEKMACRKVTAALTPPEDYVLVPVEPTEAMIEGFWGKIEHGEHERAAAEDAWRDAIAARPEVK